MEYIILRESMSGSEWVSDTICSSMMNALKIQRRIIRHSSKCYKPVKGIKYKYCCDDCILEIIENE